MAVFDQPFAVRLRRVVRYLQLYGLKRTWIKVRSYSHLRGTTAKSSLPSSPAGASEHGHVGILGCGHFAFSAIAYYLREQFGAVLRAPMDRHLDRAASLAREYRAAYFTDDARRIFDDPRIDLVFVVSNHSSHARYAIEALRAGKNVHVEKPPAVDHTELRELCDTLQDSGKSLRVGFNRPVSALGSRAIQLLLDSPGPAVMSWFVFAHDIPEGHWYLAPGEGGRVAGNLCHWIDFVYHAVAAEHRYPIVITPVRGDVADTDLCVTYRFGDGTIASINFASRGQSFEGVRERFTAQKSGIYLTLDDFEVLRVWRGEKRSTFRSRRRDHGHREAVAASYRMSRTDPRPQARPVDPAYLWEIGDLTLQTTAALEQQSPIVVHPFSAAESRATPREREKA